MANSDGSRMLFWDWLSLSDVPWRLFGDFVIYYVMGGMGCDYLICVFRRGETEKTESSHCHTQRNPCRMGILVGAVFFALPFNCSLKLWSVGLHWRRTILDHISGGWSGLTISDDPAVFLVCVPGSSKKRDRAGNRWIFSDKFGEFLL